MERVALLDRARQAGLVVRRDGDRLFVRGPKRLGDLAAHLLDRKAELMAALDAEADAGVAVTHDVFAAETGRSASEQPDVAVLRAELAVRPAAREAAIAWREAAMRAQFESVRSGDRIPFLKARPRLHVAGGRECPSCGEPSRVPGGSCDPCFAAALRVVPTDALVKKKGRR